MIYLVSIVSIYSNKKGEINNFLSNFYNTNLNIENELKWKKEFKNPIEISELVGTYVDNIEKYDIFMWISLDDDMYIYPGHGRFTTPKAEREHNPFLNGL